jgi:virulence-associated protein VagC
LRLLNDKVDNGFKENGREHQQLVQMIKGKVEIVKENECIIITPINDSITKAFGMFEGGNLTTEKFLEQKRMDKELES